MDDPALAQAMKRLTAWMDSRCRPAGIIQHSFEGAPFGGAYVCISPGDDSPYPSSNNNRVHLCGAEGGLTGEGVARLAKLFGEAGVSRYFIWLTPGPDMEAVRDWLLGAGMTRFPFVGYPTLARGVGEPSLVDTGLEVRELGVEEAVHLAGLPAEAAWPEYRRTIGLPGFCHFLAFDGNRPVASAVLCIFEELGYLCMARTAEADRGRGAQRALIAKRIEKARALGCRVLVSETLSIVPISLGNLRKAGFATVYEKEVYEATLAG